MPAARNVRTWKRSEDWQPTLQQRTLTRASMSDKYTLMLCLRKMCNWTSKISAYSKTANNKTLQNCFRIFR